MYSAINMRPLFQRKNSVVSSKGNRQQRRWRNHIAPLALFLALSRDYAALQTTFRPVMKL